MGWYFAGADSKSEYKKNKSNAPVSPQVLTVLLKFYIWLCSVLCMVTINATTTPKPTMHWLLEYIFYINRLNESFSALKPVKFSLQSSEKAIKVPAQTKLPSSRWTFWQLQSQMCSPGSKTALKGVICCTYLVRNIILNSVWKCA